MISSQKFRNAKIFLQMVEIVCVAIVISNNTNNKYKFKLHGDTLACLRQYVEGLNVRQCWLNDEVCSNSKCINMIDSFTQ